MASAESLIDKNYALLQLRMGELEHGGAFEADNSHIKDFLNALPNVDAMEVVHGRWVDKEDYYTETGFTCSVCGERYWLECFEQYNYCPNCGAKMDLK